MTARLHNFLHLLQFTFEVNRVAAHISLMRLNTTPHAKINLFLVTYWLTGLIDVCICTTQRIMLLIALSDSAGMGDYIPRDWLLTKNWPFDESFR